MYVCVELTIVLHAVNDMFYFIFILFVILKFKQSIQTIKYDIHIKLCWEIKFNIFLKIFNIYLEFFLNRFFNGFEFSKKNNNF